MLLSEMLGLIGVIVTGIITYLVARMKTQVDKNTAEVDRLTILEGRIEELNKRLDDEIKIRRAAETKVYETSMALRRAIAWIREVSEWINAGATPPPPALVDITILENAIPE